MESTPTAMRCGQGALFAVFKFLQVPTWEATHVTVQGNQSGAQALNEKSLM